MELFKLIALIIAGVLWGACLAAFLHKKDIHPIREILDRFSRLGLLCKVGVLFLVVQLTMFGGAKHGTNDVDDVTGTNDVNIVEGGTNDVGDVTWTNDVGGVSGTNELDGLMGAMPPPLMLLGSLAPELESDGVTADDVACGYRLVSVSTNFDLSYAMPPEGATIHGTWHLTGAYEDVQKVGLGDFRFPLGNNLCSSLWAYTWGKVRPQLKNISDEIAAVGVPMSAIPDVSRFWTETTSSNSYLMTWENFAAGRVATNDFANYQLPATNYQLLSAQVELFANGDFIARSNEVESVWRRRLPCDIDEDGWIDDIDPTPGEFDEDGFGPHQTLPVGDNTNYYYWVDLVVDQADARVTFEGEGQSVLPDPDFIARAGDTNRVMLLIGKSYVVNCDLPIRCVDKEDDEIEVSVAGNSLGIYWPIYLEFVSTEPLLLLASPLRGATSNGGGGWGIEVHPQRAGGGSFSWPGSFCCCSSAANGSPIFCCNGNCGCGGCYTGDITYRIGGHDLLYDGWYCSCSSNPDDPHGGEDDPDDPPASASVSVSFSEGAILFENSYTNSYGQEVYGQTTEATLNCRVYGGDHGGRFSLSFDSGDCLDRISGDLMPCDGIEVEAGEVLELETVFNGKEAGTVVAHALFVENDTSRNVTGTESLPVVEIKTKTESNWNQWQQRKELGVGEKVRLIVSPSDASSNLSMPGCQLEDDNWYYNAPHQAANQSVVVGNGDAQLTIVFQTLEPSEIRVASCWGFSNTVAGVAGNFEGHFSLYVMPTNVPFCEIEIAEIGMVATDPLGCFASPAYANWLDHSLHGGDSWHGLNRGNAFLDSVTFPLMGEWGGGGSFTWPIPNRWRIGSSGTEHNLGSYNQRFEVDFDGTSRISKFGYTFQQTTNLLFTITGGAQ